MGIHKVQRAYGPWKGFLFLKVCKIVAYYFDWTQHLMCTTNIETRKERSPGGSRRFGVRVCRETASQRGRTRPLKTQVADGSVQVFGECFPCSLSPGACSAPRGAIVNPLSCTQNNSTSPALASWGNQNPRYYQCGSDWRWRRQRWEGAEMVSGPLVCPNGWHVSMMMISSAFQKRWQQLVVCSQCPWRATSSWIWE